MDPFATVADYETFIRAPVNGEDYAAVEFNLAAACESIRKYLDQDLTLVTDDVVSVNGSGLPVVTLPQIPVLDVTAVTVDTTVLETTEWKWTPSGLLYRVPPVTSCSWGWGVRFPRGVQNVTVIYSHGFAEIPDTLKLIACLIAKDTFHTAVLAPGIKSETIGSYSYTRDDTASLSEAGSVGQYENALARYRNDRVPVA